MTIQLKRPLASWTVSLLLPLLLPPSSFLLRSSPFFFFLFFFSSSSSSCSFSFTLHNSLLALTLLGRRSSSFYPQVLKNRTMVWERNMFIGSRARFIVGHRIIGFYFSTKPCYNPYLRSFKFPEAVQLFLMVFKFHVLSSIAQCAILFSR